jgi:hypothetical protein
MVQIQPGQRVCRDHPPIPKISTAKSTGGVAQGVEHLLCEHKTLSSNHPSQPKKKKALITQVTRNKHYVRLAAIVAPLGISQKGN